MNRPRPKLLDLFCGGGGAAVGYYRAGFDVLGVDIAAKPRYPFFFIQDDALDFLDRYGPHFDVIHASPPCQRYSTMTRDPGRHPDLIAPLREILHGLGKPYVIENVPQAPLIDPVILCGSSFGLRVRRHRAFESNRKLSGLPCAHTRQGIVVGVYGKHPDTRVYLRPAGSPRAGGRRGERATSLGQAQSAMGVDWMEWRELKESIPPAYTEHIGRQLNPTCACGYWHAGPECRVCVCGRRHSVTCDLDGCRFECHADETETLGLHRHQPVTECERGHGLR